MLIVGADTYSNERIKTGPAGQVQLLFLDGSSLSIAANSEILIDEYVYDPKAQTGTYSASHALSMDDCARKATALDSYHYWAPSEGRYAVGYHSVPALFDGATSCKEYVVLLP